MKIYQAKSIISFWGGIDSCKRLIESFNSPSLSASKKEEIEANYKISNIKEAVALIEKDEPSFKTLEKHSLKTLENEYDSLNSDNLSFPEYVFNKQQDRILELEKRISSAIESLKLVNHTHLYEHMDYILNILYGEELE